MTVLTRSIDFPLPASNIAAQPAGLHDQYLERRVFDPSKAQTAAAARATNWRSRIRLTLRAWCAGSPGSGGMFTAEASIGRAMRVMKSWFAYD